MLKTVTLKKDRKQSLDRRHPWIFSRGLEDTSGINGGDLIDVIDHKGTFMARGYYEQDSIAVRILTFNKDEQINPAFWEQRVRQAFVFRQAIGLTKPREAYRLVNSEGDGLPGLIIDVFSDVIVIDAYTKAIHYHIDEILSVLLTLYQDDVKAVYYKAPESLINDIDVASRLEQVLWGDYEDIENVIALENGVSFYPEILSGQKNTYTLDQRNNRLHLRNHAQGRTVLSAFSHYGGFSLAALYGDAKEVVSLDSSSKAINILERNIRINFGDSQRALRHTSVVEDPFRYLQEMPHGAFDMIILDPPAFAKRREVLRNALQGYRKLNSEAIRKIAPHGLIYTFSNSQVVNADLFRQNIFTSALMAGREVKVLDQFGQAYDHPISIYHPEGEYLKGLLLYVE